MKTSARLRLPLTLFTAATAWAVLAWSPSASQPQSGFGILESLGEAYAREAGLTFLRADVVATDTVGTNRGELAKRLEQALAVGYAPKRGSFFLLPLGELQDLLKLEMEGGRSPSAVVNEVVTPGNVVLRVRWTFEGVKPIESHTVFSSRSELLFDTLLSLPILHGPVFSPAHS